MTAGLSIARPLPEKPMTLDEVAVKWPALRQSLLGRFDDCELSSLFAMRHENGWSTHPQARGTIYHRVCAECLREMQRQDSESVPVAVALAILEEKLRQHGVPPEDRVRVPLRELPVLEMAVAKFASDISLNIRNLIDVERRLSCTLRYTRPATGEVVERLITGQLDALFARPPDEAIVIDWKDTWALPPQHEEDADDDGAGLSYHGYFQQQLYGILVMRNYESINAVVLREFYGRRTKARSARITRQDLEKVEQRVAVLVESMDLALAAGPPPRLRLEDLERHGHWKPSPGKHCFSGATRFLTDEGVRSLRGAAGEVVRVLNRHGEWEEGVVRSFGRQRLLRVSFDSGDTVLATPDHRWWQSDGSRVTTSELRSVPLAKHARAPGIDREGVRHGFTYGDGWVRRDRGTAIARLMPHDRGIARYFGRVRWRVGGQGYVYGLPGHYKTLPTSCSPSYARGFIAGLLAADGSVDRHAGVRIFCEGIERAERIAELARLGGCAVTSVRCSPSCRLPTALSPVGVLERELATVRIRPATAPVVTARQRRQLAPRHQMRRMFANVAAIEDAGEDEVFCVTAPASESFTLANGLLTSNCFWCAKAALCPIDDDYKDGAIRTPEDAERAAGTRQKVRSIDKRVTERCKSWVDLHGPIPVKRAKGRLVLGYRKIKGGLRFEEFVPEASDRPANREAYNPNLVAAMEESVAAARRERVA